MEITFEPGSVEWRSGFEDGLHRAEPHGSSDLYESGYYLGYSVAIDRLRGGFDDF